MVIDVEKIFYFIGEFLHRLLWHPCMRETLLPVPFPLLFFFRVPSLKSGTSRRTHRRREEGGRQAFYSQWNGESSSLYLEARKRNPAKRRNGWLAGRSEETFLPRTKRVSRRRRKIKNISFPVRFALRWVMGAGEELCNFFALRIIMVRQKPKRKWPPTTRGKKASPRQPSRLFLAVLYSGEPVVPSSVSLCVQKWCTFHSFPFKVPPPPHKRLI